MTQLDTKDKKIIKKYLQEIRHFLPMYHRPEKRYLTDIKNAVIDYASSTDEISTDILIKEFGEPRVLASNYILNQDADTLQRSIRTSKYIKIAVSIVTIFLLVSLAVCIFLIHRIFRESENAYIDREVVVIENSNE